MAIRSNQSSDVRRRKFQLSFAALLGSVLVWKSMAVRAGLSAEKAKEIKFDLGQGIDETAKTSGVPQFQRSETAGLIDYSIAGVRDTVPAHFVRAGYEIVWAPIFAFTIYADRDQGG